MESWAVALLAHPQGHPGLHRQSFTNSLIKGNKNHYDFFYLNLLVTERLTKNSYEVNLT